MGLLWERRLRLSICFWCLSSVEDLYGGSINLFAGPGVRAWDDGKALLLHGRKIKEKTERVREALGSKGWEVFREIFPRHYVGPAKIIFFLYWGNHDFILCTVQLNKNHKKYTQ